MEMYNQKIMVPPLNFSAMSGTSDEDMNLEGFLDQCDNLSEFSRLSPIAAFVYAANLSEKG